MSKHVHTRIVRISAKQAEGSLQKVDDEINGMLTLLQDHDKHTVADVKISCAVHEVDSSLLLTYLVICED